MVLEDQTAEKIELCAAVRREAGKRSPDIDIVPTAFEGESLFVLSNKRAAYLLRHLITTIGA